MSTDNWTIHSGQPLQRAGDSRGLTFVLDSLFALLALPGHTMRRVVESFESARRYKLTVKELRSLDDKMLRDIGVERDQIVHLVSRLNRERLSDWP